MSSSQPSGNIDSQSYGGGGGGSGYGGGGGMGVSSDAPNDDGSGNLLSLEKLDLDLDLGGSDGNLPSSFRASDLDMDDLLEGLENSDGQLQGTGEDGGHGVGVGLLDLDDGGDDVTNPSDDPLLGQLSNHGEQPPQHPPEMSSMEKLLTMDLIEVDDEKLRSELNEDLGITSMNYHQEQDTMLLQQYQEQQQQANQLYHFHRLTPRRTAQPFLCSRCRGDAALSFHSKRQSFELGAPKNSLHCGRFGFAFGTKIQSAA